MASDPQPEPDKLTAELERLVAIAGAAGTSETEKPRIVGAAVHVPFDVDRDGRRTVQWEIVRSRRELLEALGLD